ncbi:MAG: 50S ribosomal protein L21, partial [Deltaproteobacteria bacterium]
QFKVEKNMEIFVHQLEGEKDTAVSFENVLLLDNEGTVTVGAPVVNGAVIQAKILDHVRGDKVIVFHKKRRKGYQKQNGHRQYFSKILIEDILTDGKKAASSKKKKAVSENPVETALPEVEIKSEN